MKNFLKILMGVLLFLCSARAAQTQTTDLKVGVTQSDLDFYEVSGEFSTTAPLPTVWDVLQDYEHIPNYISSMQSCSVRSRTPDELLVEQVFKDGFLFWKKKTCVLLKIQETPQKEIAFQDISKKDFGVYDGFWQLKQKGDKVKVFYQLNVRVHFFLPGFLTENILKGMIKKLFEELNAELKRRTQATGGSFQRL